MLNIKKKLNQQVLNFDINSTAPVSKIVKEVEDKNVNAATLYKQCLGRRSRGMAGEHWALVAHPMAAFPDDWNGELNYGYFEKFNYKGTLPKMVTKLRNIDKCDPLTQYIRIKEEWQTELKNLHVKSDRIRKNYKRLSAEVAECPKVFVNLAKHYYSDPDPNFKSAYNWYYAGHGNLQLVVINYSDYLLHSEFHYLYLSEFKRYDMKILPHTATFDCGENNNILETITNNHLIALRTMHWVFILKIIDEDQTVSIQLLKKVNFKIVCTGISFDHYHNNILYINKLDNMLTIVNTTRMTKLDVELQKTKSLLNNWNTIVSSDRVTYCHITPEYVSIYDKRTHKSSVKFDNILELTDMLCNKITSAKLYEDSLYVGTYHNLFALDIRYNNSKGRIVQRWTHLMQSSPTYVSMCPFEINRELICLSSQWCEDLCVVPADGNNLCKGKAISGVTVPYRPPSILTTLHEAKSSKMCFNINNPIDDRLLTSISGMVCIELDEKYMMLQHNTLGDITAHVLYPDYLDFFMQEDSKEVLHEWCKDYVVEPKPFVVTRVYDCKKFLRKLKRLPDDSTYLDGEPSKDIQFSMKELAETFADEIVDSGLLDAWGVTVDDLKQAAEDEENSQGYSEKDELNKGKYEGESVESSIENCVEDEQNEANEDEEKSIFIQSDDECLAMYVLKKTAEDKVKSNIFSEGGKRDELDEKEKEYELNSQAYSEGSENDKLDEKEKEYELNSQAYSESSENNELDEKEKEYESKSQAYSESSENDKLDEKEKEYESKSQAYSESSENDKLDEKEKEYESKSQAYSESSENVKLDEKEKEYESTNLAYRETMKDDLDENEKEYQSSDEYE